MDQNQPTSPASSTQTAPSAQPATTTPPDPTQPGMAPQSTPTPKPSSLKKIILVLVAFIALTSVVTAAYFFYQNQQLKNQPITPPPTPLPSTIPTPEPDSSNNWQTYTNPTYNFQFQYPSQWQLIVDTRSNEKEFRLKKNNQVIVGTIFSGSLDSTADNQNQGVNHTFVTTDYYLFINYLECESPGCGAGSQDLPTYYQILSTFKFTDNDTASLLTSSWNTYTNTLYHYSISFPHTWKAINQADGSNGQPPPPDANMIDIYDRSQPARPYPSGVITIQHVGLQPTYPDSWQQEAVTLNGHPSTKYYTPNGLDGPTYTYLISSPDGSYIEVLFRSSPEDNILDTFNQIIASFQFTN